LGPSAIEEPFFDQKIERKANQITFAVKISMCQHQFTNIEIKFSAGKRNRKKCCKNKRNEEKFIYLQKVRFKILII